MKNGFPQRVALATKTGWEHDLVQVLAPNSEIAERDLSRTVHLSTIATARAIISRRRFVATTIISTACHDLAFVS